MTPGALGFFEGGLVAFFAAVGLAEEQATAFALFTRAGEIVILIIGLWLIFHYGLKFVAWQVAKKLSLRS